MDPGIVETVALVNLLGFPTNNSCEGHTDHGMANPWVRITAPGEPEYTHVGEREEKERIAASYGMQAGDIERGKNDTADEAYYSWLRDNDVPFTPEFESWRALQDAEFQKAKALVNEFNAGRHDAEAIRFERGHITAGVDEQVEASTDMEGLPARLEARREVMRAFTEFLRQKYQGTLY